MFGKQVIVQYNDLDRCSRVFGKVIVNGQDAKLRQVQAGLAWHYKYYQSGQSPSDRQAYSTAEIQARQTKLSLWAAAHPVAPCDWRRGERERPWLTRQALRPTMDVVLDVPAIR